MSGEGGRGLCGVPGAAPSRGTRPTLLSGAGWQSSSLTPKARGADFLFFFMRLMPQGAFWELLSSGGNTTMGLFVKSQDGQTARASLLCWGGGERVGTPPCQEHRFAMRGSPCRRGAPTFHYGRILPRGPGCAGSRLLQELGSDPQPTGALGRGVGLGTRRAVGRAGSGGHSRDRAPWMGPHQPPHKARCLPACPGSCPGPMGAHGALPALWCSPHRAAPPCWGATGVSPTPVPGEFRALLTPCWELA